MSDVTTAKLNNMKEILKKGGAKELTPENGIALRMDLRAPYLLEERRYLVACLEGFMFMWDLNPTG